ncbi:hypothetical protein DLINEEME_00240 [Klebsiella phage 066042]|uniref:Uncharacterized protein n=1 Tax=Klebsiella phage 066042 TaxID=2777399 RepID=A0A7S6U418_9CAUD|nr:hypothetical protein DLINEEME_00240 [Klebsiella phage 066042]
MAVSKAVSLLRRARPVRILTVSFSASTSPFSCPLRSARLSNAMISSLSCCVVLPLPPMMEISPLTRRSYAGIIRAMSKSLRSLTLKVDPSGKVTGRSLSNMLRASRNELFSIPTRPVMLSSMTLDAVKSSVWLIPYALSMACFWTTSGVTWSTDL